MARVKKCHGAILSGVIITTLICRSLLLESTSFVYFLHNIHRREVRGQEARAYGGAVGHLNMIAGGRGVMPIWLIHSLLGSRLAAIGITPAARSFLGNIQMIFLLYHRTFEAVCLES